MKKQLARHKVLITLGWILAMVAGGAQSANAAATASFVRGDTTTQGNWQGVYGADGHSVDNDSQIIPGYASFAVQNYLNWTWAFNSSDPRALQTSSRPGRIAAAWYSSADLSLDVNFTDGKSHPFALYAVDWDQRGRAETIQIVDANTNAVLSSQNISNFSGGIYLIWNVSGHVKVNANMTAGPNAVISGVFFGGTATSVSSATFVGSDTTTEGNWKGVYGADGHSLTGDSQTIPSYAAFAVRNQYNWIWSSNPSDPRALQTASRSGRIAATWYNSSGFSLDVNLTDGNSHQFALYAVDWDSRGRSERIQVINATSNAVLDSRSISGFAGGIYIVWNISGHVKINVSSTSGPNPVVSGVFFQGTSASSSSSAPPISTTSPVASQGQLSVNPVSLAFGNVNVGSSSTQSIAVSNSGTASVSISSVSISGAGLNASGLSGITLSPGQTTNLAVTFSPAATGSITGGVTLLSNAKNSSIAIALSGKGVQPPPVSHSVALNWSPSTSTGIVGYNVYRSSAANSSYTQLTASPVATTSYTDSTAQSGQTYYYAVTSVNSSGAQSTFSNLASVNIP